jgi:hypothetical protein
LVVCYPNFADAQLYPKKMDASRGVFREIRTKKRQNPGTKKPSAEINPAEGPAKISQTSLGSPSILIYRTFSSFSQ